eukprot:scaffold3912_cov136-Amphora_coffeaeformis.AAC.2
MAVACVEIGKYLLEALEVTFPESPQVVVHRFTINHDTHFAGPVPFRTWQGQLGCYRVRYIVQHDRPATFHIGDHGWDPDIGCQSLLLHHGFASSGKKTSVGHILAFVIDVKNGDDDEECVVETIRSQMGNFCY